MQMLATLLTRGSRTQELFTSHFLFRCNICSFRKSTETTAFRISHFRLSQNGFLLRRLFCGINTCINLLINQSIKSASIRFTTDKTWTKMKGANNCYCCTWMFFCDSISISLLKFNGKWPKSTIYDKNYNVGLKYILIKIIPSNRKELSNEHAWQKYFEMNNSKYW